MTEELEARKTRQRFRDRQIAKLHLDPRDPEAPDDEEAEAIRYMKDHPEEFDDG